MKNVRSNFKNNEERFSNFKNNEERSSYFKNK